jgi:DNA-binding response OmpR family regulator
VVDVYVRYLRQKIDPEGAVPLIQTVRGFGYMIAAPANGSGPNRNGDGR